MNAKTLLIASTAALGMSGAAFADGDIVYDQLDDLHSGFPSDGVAGQYFDQRIIDDFVITGSGTIDINGVVWRGGSENFAFADLTNFSDFVIEIYPDDGAGAPDVSSPLLSMSVATGMTNPTATGSTNDSGGTIFEQEVKFSPLSLDRGVIYYVSVGADNVTSDGDAYVWNNALMTVNDTFWFEQPVDSGSVFMETGEGDMSFQIQAVPAPGALALLGLAGLTSRRRRRRG